MNRRRFLAALGFGTVAAAAAANHILDIERLLWIPGEKTIFIPNDEYYLGWISREAARYFNNNLTFAAKINRIYDDRYVTGPTVRVALPRRFAL